MSRWMMIVWAVGAVVLSFVSACSKERPAQEKQGTKTDVSAVVAAPAAAPAPSPVAIPDKPDYADPKSWLCRPGREDACSADLTTTVVKADGSLTREAWKANPKAEVDCFYVYPTVSNDATPNSDVTPGDEERGVVRGQAARFGSQCRVYAPLYRQVTLTALRGMLRGKPMAGDRKLGYGDVVAAWNHYLEHDNGGRGVVLIGHSQGASMLTQLVSNEIDGKPIQKQLVSALLIGTNLNVPRGKDVGGSFQHVPLCRSATQLGCAISYASFRANVPPPASSRFAQTQDDKLVSACTNPAALRGGSGNLHAYLAPGRMLSSAEPQAWVTPAKPIETSFVSVPGLLSAECVVRDKKSFLAVTVHANPKDPRTDDIVGDVVTDGKVQPDWGLHVIDMHLAMGNLVGIVAQQAKAYLARRPSAAALPIERNRTRPESGARTLATLRAR
jgi:hypothetical protein